MSLNKKLLTILIVLLFVNTSIAQTTAIPDAAFEQALIDLGIDSDGVINGQVLAHINFLGIKQIISPI
jgi:hypothetical protein